MKPKPVGHNTKVCLCAALFLIYLEAALSLVDYFPRDKNPHSFVARHNLAVALARMGQEDEAYEQEKMALRGVPTNMHIKWTGHMLMSNVRLKRGWDSLAMQSLKAVMILNPQSVQAYKQLSFLYSKHGAKENAERVLQVALNIDKRDGEAWEMLKAVQQ